MRPLCLILCVLLMGLGCSESTPSSAGGDNRGSKAAAEAPPPSESATASWVHPTTLDELQATYTRAFDSGDKATIEALIYWGESSDADRAVTRRCLVEPAGTQKTLALKVLDVDPLETERDYTINDQQVLEITMRVGDESSKYRSSSTVDWHVGEIDGKYYFGAWHDPPK